MKSSSTEKIMLTSLTLLINLLFVTFPVLDILLTKVISTLRSRHCETTPNFHSTLDLSYPESFNVNNTTTSITGSLLLEFHLSGFNVNIWILSIKSWNQNLYTSLFLSRILVGIFEEFISKPCPWRDLALLRPKSSLFGVRISSPKLDTVEVSPRAIGRSFKSEDILAN